MIRVLIVDDSRVIREVFRYVLSREPDIEVVGEAEDPYVAREQIVALKPDVLTLDMEMPRMDGLTFLRALMTHHPLPVVVVSSITARGGALAMEAFAAGAVCVLQKPMGRAQLETLGPTLAGALRAAAGARLQTTAAAELRPRAVPRVRADRVVAIGASTGGTVAIEQLLRALPAQMPPLVITQHMPPGFTRAFAERLERITQLRVREAEDGAQLEPGLALVAPGGKHLVVRSSPRGLCAEVREGPRVSGHCPSVDVLFRSVANAAQGASVGVLLTGMGRDGAVGLRQLRDAGAATFAQDEATSVVFGMPKAAHEEGAVDGWTPLDALPAALLAALG